MIFYTKHQPTGPPLVPELSFSPTKYQLELISHISLALEFIFFARPASAITCSWFYFALAKNIIHAFISTYAYLSKLAYHRLGLCPSRGRLDSLVSSPCTLSVVLLLHFFRGARIIQYIPSYGDEVCTWSRTEIWCTWAPVISFLKKIKIHIFQILKKIWEKIRT
jgi:hypothetical protein